MHANLWGQYDLFSQSRSTYAAIFICEHTRKTWTLYLQGKNNFIDAFQACLFQAEAKSGFSMKILKADSGREFILHKL